MREPEPSVNPLTKISKAARRVKSIFEIPLNLARFPQILRQRRDLQPQDAENWLNIAIAHLLEVQDQTILREGDQVIPNGYIGTGLTNTCFLFSIKRADERRADVVEKYVLKIGGNKSFAIGYPAPSTEEFAQWYLHSLNILRAVSKDRLPDLVPEPQEVLFVTSQQRSTTLIIQPYYPELLGLRALYHLRPEEQEQLLGEFEKFREISEILDREHGLIPDFGQLDNVTIARTPTGPHFVMIDNEMKDRLAPSPFMNFFESRLRDFRIKQIDTRLRRTIRINKKHGRIN